MSRNRKNYKNRNNQKNNFQDRAETREFNKGFRQGLDKRFNRSQNTFEDAKSPVVTGSGDNDASWYVANNQMVKDAAAASFMYATGAPVNVHSISESPLYQPINVPGIMALRVCHTIGNAHSPEDPINVAGNSLFAYLQQKTGRSPVYSMSEVIVMLHAIIDAYSYYAFLTRIYGLMNTYSLQNKYTPIALVRANCVSFSDSQSDLANLRTAINQFAFRLASFPMPKNITLATKRIHEFETVYTDAANAKAQYYMFVPDGFWYLVEGDEDDPITHLSFAPIPQPNVAAAELLTVQQLIDLGNKILKPLYNSEDLRILAADILNAFPNELMTVSPISEVYNIDYEYNKDIAAQIENAYIYGVTVDEPNMRIGETEESGGVNGGYVESKYGFVLSNNLSLANSDWKPISNPLVAFQSRNFLYNVHDDAYKTPEEVLHLTRYSGIGVTDLGLPDGETLDVWSRYIYKNVRAQAFDIITNAWIFKYGITNAGATQLQVTRFSTLTILSPATHARDMGLITSLLSRFDWHPKAGFIYGSNPGPGALAGNLGMTDACFDIDMFAEIPESQLENINYLAQLGCFTARDLGAYSRME